jgi:hypothetical protein
LRNLYIYYRISGVVPRGGSLIIQSTLGLPV